MCGDLKNVVHQVHLRKGVPGHGKSPRGVKKGQIPSGKKAQRVFLQSNTFSKWGGGGPGFQ